MEILIKIINYLGYSNVTVNSDPLVLYACTILVLSILALVGYITTLFYLSLIILGYNQKFIQFLSKKFNIK